jgi:Spy/CpxP family protein refolding chaperone
MVKRILFVGLCAGIMASTLTYAQRGGGGGGKGGGKGPDIPMGSFTQSRLDRLATQLNLNKDQKKDLKQVFDDAQKEATPLHDQLAKARMAVGEAVTSGKSPDDVAKVCASVADLDAQMTQVELNALVKAVAILPDEQKQRGAQMLFATTRGLFAGKNWNEAQ